MSAQLQVGEEYEPESQNNKLSANPSQPQDTEEEIVCEHTNPSVLYKLLDAGDWDSAQERCRSYPREVRTWIVRHEASKSSILWKLLPLHAAIIFKAPVAVLRTLLNQYPDATSLGDDHGMTPLHLAFKVNKDEDVLELLILHCPESIFCRDRKNRTPIDYSKGKEYSTKLMGLYADAAVTSVKSLQNSREETRDEKCSGNTGRESDSSTQESRIQAIAEDYEKQMTKLKNIYEERITVLNEHSRLARKKLVIDSQKSIRELKEKHQEEIEKVRKSAQKEEANRGGGKLAHNFGRMIEQYRSEAKQAQADNEMLLTIVKGMKAFNEELTSEVREINEDQKELQRLFSIQQEELESAQAMRKQLLRTLLEQEEEDNRSVGRAGKETTDLLDNVQNRIEKLLARSPPPSFDIKSITKVEKNNASGEDSISTMTDMNR